MGGPVNDKRVINDRGAYFLVFNSIGKHTYCTDEGVGSTAGDQKVGEMFPVDAGHGHPTAKQRKEEWRNANN
jgi:hypothetical protein